MRQQFSKSSLSEFWNVHQVALGRYALSNDIKIDDLAWPWTPFPPKLSKFRLFSSISRKRLQIGPQLLRLTPIDPAEFNGAIFRPIGVPQMGVFNPQISNFDYISELRQRNFTKLLAHVDYDARVAWFHFESHLQGNGSRSKLSTRRRAVC